MRATTLDRVVVAGFIVLLSVLRSGTIPETDVYWEVREGFDLLDGAPLVRPDSWGWDPVPQLFYPNSPAWAVIVGTAWRVGGSWGLFLVSTAYLIGCLSAVTWVARRLGARWIPILMALMLAALVGMPLLSPRSSFGSLVLLMAATVFGVWFGRRSIRLPAAVAIAIASVAGFAWSFAGTWWHASWATLAVLAGIAWTLAWLVLPGIPRWRAAGMSVAGLAGLMTGVLVGPLGTAAWERSSAVFRATRGLVFEWEGAFAPSHVLVYGIPAMAMAVGIGFVIWRLSRRLLRQRTLGPRDTLSWLLAGQAAAFAVAGLVAVRFTWLAAFLFAPVLARGLTTVMTSEREASRAGGRLRAAIHERMSDQYWRVILTTLLIVLVPVAGYLAVPHAEPPTSQVVHQLPPGCRLFSTDVDASIVLLERPDVRVWIDGRLDYWGRDRLQAALDYYVGSAPGGLVPEGTTCVLLPEAGSDRATQSQWLAQALTDSPDWTVLARANGRVIWVPAGS